MWVWLTLGSGIFNALWTSRVKMKVNRQGGLPFTLSMRWGVGLCLLPLALWTWKPVPAGWWIYTIFAGLLECLSLWAMARGMARDYYATYALSNTTPFFVAMGAVAFLHETLTPTVSFGILLVVAGALWLYYRGHWSWWGLGAALLGTGSSLCSKEVIGLGSASAHSGLAFGLGALLLTPIAHGSTPADWKTLARNTWENRFLILFSSTATLLFYYALPLAPLSQVSPLVRINLVIGFLLSYFHLGETQTWKSRAFGAVLILAGIVLVLWRG